jgi:hypothetical protein
MGFGNGAFQNARIAIDGVTIIETIETGKVTGSQGNAFYEAVISNPQISNTAWGFTEVGHTSVHEPYSINAQASWATPSLFAGIGEGLVSSATVSIGGQIDGIASSSTTVTNTLTIPSNTKILVVFITTTSINSTAPPTITDTEGNTWTQRAVENIQQSAGAIWEFYTTSPTAGSDTITATFSSATDCYMTSVPLFSSGTISYISSSNPQGANNSDYPVTFTGKVYTTLGTTPLLNVEGNSTLYATSLVFFGGITKSYANSSIVPNIGNAFAFWGNPLSTSMIQPVVGKGIYFNGQNQWDLGTPTTYQITQVNATASGQTYTVKESDYFIYNANGTYQMTLSFPTATGSGKVYAIWGYGAGGCSIGGGANFNLTNIATGHTGLSGVTVIGNTEYMVIMDIASNLWLIIHAIGTNP